MMKRTRLNRSVTLTVVTLMLATLLVAGAMTLSIFAESGERYTVTWIVDGRETTAEYAYGETPTFSGNTDKAPSAKYSYKFKGWHKTVVPVTGNATYIAQYATTVNAYTVTWDVNGEKTTETYRYGQIPTFSGNTDKAPTAQYTYAFQGWDKNIAPVTADVTYTARYTETVNKYTVTFEYGDGKTHTVTVAYGQAATAPTDTHKAATDSTVYTFDGWDVAFDNVTADLTVKAKYTEAPVPAVTDPAETDTVTDLGTDDPTTEPDTHEQPAEKDDTWIWFIILIIVVAAVIAIILLRRKSESEDDPQPEAKTQPRPEPAAVVPPVKEETSHVGIVKEVSVDDVDKLMSNARAAELLEETQERGGKGKMGIVNVGLICPCFEAGAVITLNDLKAKGLVEPDIGRVKVLASGSINKPLTVKADAFSVQAIKMITVTGGHAVKLKGEDR